MEHIVKLTAELVEINRKLVANALRAQELGADNAEEIAFEKAKLADYQANLRRDTARLESLKKEFREIRKVCSTFDFTPVDD
jgi:hypothetical protein